MYVFTLASVHTGGMDSKSTELRAVAGPYLNY